MFAHIAQWAASGSTDVKLLNPHFDSESDKIAIYCVHGTADRAGAFTYIANQLLPQLPSNVESINLLAFEQRARGEKIETFAEQLAKKIQAEGHKKIILFGHSRGGLVGASFTEDLAKGLGIGVIAIFAIGTPFQGSDLASKPLSWISASVEQMSRNSLFLGELNTKIATSSTRYICYGGISDWIVVSQSARAIAPSCSFEAFKEGHLSLMSSEPLIQSIARNLQNICLRHARGEPISQELTASQVVAEFVDVQDSYPMLPVCADIFDQLKDLTQRTHWYSIEEKVAVLIQLIDLLNTVSRQGRNPYPAAKTIKDFIHAYLQDETIIGGRKPADILNDHLMPLVGRFSASSPSSKTALDVIAQKYGNEPLLPDCPARNVPII